MIRKLAQKLIVASVAPYVRAELPKWGRVYRSFVGSLERDEFWRQAGTRTVQNKLYGFRVDCDLSRWPERQTFFLGRWFDLPAQLLIASAAGRGGVVIDVGANRGQFTLAAASIVGKTGSVISFEPNPLQAATLKRDLARNQFRNVTVNEVGLSDEPALLDLCVPDINSGGASFGGFAREGSVVENLQVIRGDDALTGIRPDLIKIDVEGFELKVLKGLRETIHRAQPVILTEVIPEHLERCGASTDLLFGFMRDIGYHGAGIGTRRLGGLQHLTIGPLEGAADVVWVPRHRDLESLVCSTADLHCPVETQTS